MDDVAEELARALRVAGQVETEELVRPSALAERLGVRIELVGPKTWRHPGRALSYRFRGKQVVELVTSSPKRFREFLVAHELAELEGLRLGLNGPEVEELADRAAGCLIAPSSLFRRALQLELSDIADRFYMTRSAVALRVGEVTGKPTALVTPLSVRRRGEPRWPEDEVLRMWAEAPPDSVVSVPIKEGPKRRAIQAT